VAKFKLLISGMGSNYVLGGGLEPGFRVPFSTIFHSIAQGNCHQRGKQWKTEEAKLLQTAASLRTFFVWVISARALKSLVAFLGYSCLAAERLSNELAAEAERAVGATPSKGSPAGS
jgi:hypothetical protein